VPKESVIFGIAGVFFGVLVGWIIGSQQAVPVRQTPAPAAEAQSPQAQSRTAPPFDESRAAALKATADSNPKDVATRVELGNLYFDHDRFSEAVRWYEDALVLDPRNADVSTDLGIAYYYMNQPDAALKQFDRSLAIDARHTKTLLNIGIVRAFGKQDLEGAVRAWEKVIEIAPSSTEAATARQALAGVRSAHPEAGSGGGTPPAPSRVQDKPE
jgi:cytochrome c-type biogenesis protein CcmH/NrfG